ncbi:aromatase/cyclase [Streptomyces griseus]|uniref:aromatase/cyclase n=1 Tax=Streptomyces griseus TaxID=1911 RepID=UPI00055C36C5|nr:aromatase/cyclase [Streptomyces griseus]
MPYPHETEHQIRVRADADTVFGLLADVSRWPLIFPPTVHAEQIEREGDTERIRIWATANDKVKGWISRRTLDRSGLRIRFRQEASQAPVAGMGGTWLIEPVTDDEVRVRLLHDFRAVGDSAENIAWIEQAIDRNSDAELAALKRAAESAGEAHELELSFSDAVRIAGPAEAVYDFINEADRWQERLPHVTGVDLTEEVPGVQMLTMETRTADGNSHTTTSVRVCRPSSQILYKQLKTPALMAVHTGEWRLEEDQGSTLATSFHTVVVKPEAIADILGPQATVGDARTYLRDALGRNSTATLRHAKAYAEASVTSRLP